MGTRLLITKPREIGYGEYDERTLKSNEVRLKTIYSGISQGTELTVYRGLNPYMLKKWDSEKKLFVKSEETSLKFPAESGYEAVGQVIEVGSGVSKVKAGDVVYGGEWYGWTHKTTISLLKMQPCGKGCPPTLIRNWVCLFHYCKHHSMEFWIRK